MQASTDGGDDRAELLERAVEKGVLSGMEGEMIRRIDLDGEGLTVYAASVSRAKSSVSTDHAKALRRFKEFSRDEERRRGRGELAARVFELLDNRTTLTAIVRETRADPDAVKELYLKWHRLKERDVNAPSVPKLIRGLSGTAENLAETVKIFDSRLTDVEVRLGAMPFSGLSAKTCENCGSEGLFAIHYKCTKCNSGGYWGYWPK